MDEKGARLVAGGVVMKKQGNAKAYSLVGDRKEWPESGEWRAPLSSFVRCFTADGIEAVGRRNQPNARNTGGRRGRTKAGPSCSSRRRSRAPPESPTRQRFASPTLPAPPPRTPTAAGLIACPGRLDV